MEQPTASTPPKPIINPPMAEATMRDGESKTSKRTLRVRTAMRNAPANVPATIAGPMPSVRPTAVCRYSSPSASGPTKLNEVSATGSNDSALKYVVVHHPTAISRPMTTALMSCAKLLRSAGCLKA